MVSREDVQMAYRLILGREPESDDAIECHRMRADLASLREHFLESNEFRLSRVTKLPMDLDLAPALRLDLDIPPRLLERMFQRVEETWRRLAATEPYHSVLVSDDFRSVRFGEHAAEYHESGRGDVERLLAWLRRNRIELEKLSSCCEYGCGTGRITAWLAPHFQRLVACDISAPYLKLAEQHLASQGIANVTLRGVPDLRSLRKRESVDLVFSILVLQHNPPPVMAFLLRTLLGWLNRNGVAYLQLPTYALGYQFDAERYLSGSEREMEMHVLPQSAVFAIAAEEDCTVLEVAPDHMLGDSHWISSTFLFRKR
jgi:SAM-dependent methyltransferase